MAALAILHFYTGLTNFMPLISFDTPGKHQKTRGFLMMFSDVFRLSKEISAMKGVNQKNIVARHL